MAYLGRRIGFYLVTAWAAITINFFIPRLMPGNPVQILLSRLSGNGELTPRMVRDLTIAFGLNTKTGLLGQYGQYWAQLFHGNLGTSITYYPSSVASVVAAALPWTVVLIGTATVISYVIGTVLGTLAAWRRGSALDGLLPATTFLYAMPLFWLALVAIELFGVKLRWLPTSGGEAQGIPIAFTGQFLSSAIDHSVLPALVIVITLVASPLLGMRNMMVTTLNQDYVLVAQAKGLSQRRVMVMYAARNAILPTIANFALSLGFVVSGALLVEIVFSYPGIGYILLQAVGNEDYPLMQAIFLIITLAVLVANLLADLVYVLLDPRSRQEA
jgi:peptide/nickel transport system permease protein